MKKVSVRIGLKEFVTSSILSVVLVIMTFLYVSASETIISSNDSSDEESFIVEISEYPLQESTQSPEKSRQEESSEDSQETASTSMQTSSDSIITPRNIGEALDVPEISTHVKFCTDYRAYNIEYTPHYRLQQLAWTDDYGLRRYHEDYLVALGSYYSTKIGDRFLVTLETGKTFTVMLADGKWDIDCDTDNMYTPTVDYNGEYAGNLLEFIIDETQVSPEMYQYGSLDYYEEFKGSVVSMIYLGRDQSADWDTYE